MKQSISVLQHRLLQLLVVLCTFLVLPHLSMRGLSQVNSIAMHFTKEFFFSIAVVLDINVSSQTVNNETYELQ
jgi:hypothetical protein